MSKRLGGIIGCKYKISSWHLNGFPYGSNIELIAVKLVDDWSIAQLELDLTCVSNLMSLERLTAAGSGYMDGGEAINATKKKKKA